MNREILFRGQTRKFGEKTNLNGDKLPGNWVYGGIFPQNNGGCYSVIYTNDPSDKHLVYADTVGQYTGLIDKNGTKIFGGDILCYEYDGEKVYGIIRFGEIKDEKFENIGCFVDWQGNGENLWSKWRRKDLLYWIKEGCKVVGNIFDNPELLAD